MAYTVTKLITNAYYLSGIVSRDFETVSGPQLQDGLDSLNDVLSDTTADQGMIPYYKKHDFTAVVGQEEYFIENLIEIDTLVFFINQVRYSMIDNGRRIYFGAPRAQNVQSLPFNYHVEREFGGARIFLYFKPQATYPMQLWGLFRLPEMAFNDDISLTTDRFYIDYLKYKLTERLCDNYSYIVPPGVTKRLMEIESAINKRMGEMDLTQQVMSTLTGDQNSLNYAQANLGRGFTI